jgi:hypothetical protein
VTENQARVVPVEIDAIVAVGVPDVGAVPALEIERVRIEERGSAAVAARHGEKRLLEQRAGARRLGHIFVDFPIHAHRSLLVA